jgi:transcriptional regulator with XRE-family HTH domain
MILHNKIKKLRKEKGLTQQELADEIGLHITHLSRIENGHLTPSLDVFKKLAAIYDVSTDFLLNEAEENYDVKIRDKTLAEKIRLIDNLEEDDRKALVQIINTMLTKQKMRELLLQGASG